MEGVRDPLVDLIRVNSKGGDLEEGEERDHIRHGNEEPSTLRRLSLFSIHLRFLTSYIW